MQIVGTREAFMTLINTRGIYKILGVERSTVAGWKNRTRNGEGITLDKMKEILARAGITYQNELVWHFTSGMIKVKISMFDIHQQVAKAEIGTEITIDYSEGASEILINNALNRTAIRLGCLVYRDDKKRPIVKYDFRA